MILIIDSTMKSRTKFKALTKREQEVLVYRGDKLTFREIGAKYGVSKQRAKQIEQLALRKGDPLFQAHLNILWSKMIVQFLRSLPRKNLWEDKDGLRVNQQDQVLS